MPDRLQTIGFIIESLFLTLINAFILMTWFTLFSAIPIVLSSLWSIGKIKRDIDRHHGGSPMTYIKYLLGLVKKN